MDRELKVFSFLARPLDLDDLVASTCEVQQYHGADQYEMFANLGLSSREVPRVQFTQHSMQQSSS